MKKTFITLGLAVLGVVIGGCGGSSSGNTPTPTPADPVSRTTAKIFQAFKQNKIIELQGSLTKTGVNVPLTGNFLIRTFGEPDIFQLNNASLAANGSSFSGTVTQPIHKAFNESFPTAQQAQLQPLIGAFQNGNKVDVRGLLRGEHVNVTVTITNTANGHTVSVPFDQDVSALRNVQDFDQLSGVSLLIFLENGATPVL